jgi:hypothetical protein
VRRRSGPTRPEPGFWPPVLDCNLGGGVLVGPPFHREANLVTERAEQRNGGGKVCDQQVSMVAVPEMRLLIGEEHPAFIGVESAQHAR